MKITIDELRGLNVEAYINWMLETVDKMNTAYKLIPLRMKEFSRLVFSQLSWRMYFEELKPDNANYTRYEKFKELADKQFKELQAEIKSMDNDLEQVTALAKPIDTANLMKETISNIQKQTLPLLPTDETDTDKPLTLENLHTYILFQNEYIKNWEYRNPSLNYRVAQTIDFDEIIGSINGIETVFRSHLDYDLDKFRRMQPINANATSTVLKEATEKDFKYIDWILGASFCRQFFYEIEVVIEFALIAYYSHVAKGDISTETVSNSPLKWIGKPSQLGYVMHLLEDSGYIEAPKKRNGEINYSEYARTITRAFQFEGNNDSYLAKSLNPESNNMENENKAMFTIPHIKDIS